MRGRVSRLVFVLLLGFPVAALAADDRPALLAGVKAPAGWKVTLFAAPPDVRYPTCLAAAPTGEVFVGIDENGSLDAKPKRGRVVRCVDTDDDGRADRFTDFALMDSPRGVVYDAGTLYVLHPPDLTAYHDDDGDGRADRTEDLVKGIGFDLKFRGADHTTNGIRLAIDGFLYVAVGDYGFVKAVGKDGATVSLRGGGIARVRPDGTGLQVVSRGQRNIYDVAVDPFLNLFTRDNTNDGGGWDVRLSHVVPTAQMGYPSLFTNFPAEIVQPLADYGGGSPCGSLYVQEPGLPPGFGDTLYTCDWGRGIVYRHPLSPQGAGFQAGQEVFVEVPRPTDADIDGRGRLFLSSWREGSFTFSGPNVGFVIRVSPPGPERPPFPDLKKAAVEKLASEIGSGSAVMRLAAQREILRRGVQHTSARQPLSDMIVGDHPLPARVAALFTRSIDGTTGFLPAFAEGPTDRSPLREFALRALADHPRDAADIPVAPFVSALSDPRPRVRLQAVVGLGILGKRGAAARVVPLLADPDPLVSHAAVNALVSLRAIEPCLAALEPATPALAPGAARVLQSLHEAKVVDGLIEALHAARGDTLRRPILQALCRLDHREADWKGEWWGTRPDTSGPYYRGVAWDETPKIEQALRSALGSADRDTTRWLLGELLRHKVELEGTTTLALREAAADPAFRATAVGLLAGRPDLSSEAVAFLGRVAGSETEATSLRARALHGLVKHADKPAARDTAVAALAAVTRLDAPPPELLDAVIRFVGDGRRGREVALFTSLADGPDHDRGVLAYAVLVHLAENPRRADRRAGSVSATLDKAWARPETATRLLRAVGLTRAKGFAPRVTDRLRDPDPSVRAAATAAAQALGLGSPSGGPALAGMAYEKVVDGAKREKGDPSLGAQLFQRQGCVNCHTVSKSEGLKGPYLGDIANRYSRTELAESILKPSARIAQGFETQKFALTSGQVLEGFVVRESGDEVEIRDGKGEVAVVPKPQIEERGKSEISIMPTGLADPLSVRELASILAYLESLRSQTSK
jgi:putative heme-binding domain-containing protein